MLNEDDYTRLRHMLIIDPHSLDDALINLAMEQMEITEYTAEAATVRDTAKFQYDQVVADVAVKMREADDKMSETRIKSEVPLFDEVVEAHSYLLDAERDYSLWRGLADAIRTKGSSIRAIADLIAAGYMTSTTIRNDRNEVLHQYRSQRPG